MISTESRLSLTPGIPSYAQARAFMHAIQSTPYPTYRSMVDMIWDQIGNPKENVDWTSPEEWIPERLSGEEQALAFKIWRDTKGLVNPRHTRGCWYLCYKHNLLFRDSADRLQLTMDGQVFQNQPESDLIAQIDRSEGLLTVLQIVSEHTPGKRSEILPGYIEFCDSYTNYHTIAVHKSSLYDRLVNLLERGFIRRSGNFYEISEVGIQYLSKYGGLVPGRSIPTAQSELQKITKGISSEARQRLKDFLLEMDPYRFEHLVGMLLQDMGYTDIVVTSPSNDKGVDVVAEIELGISSVREVVQVKRYSGSINRNVLDQLRGSLYRFKAFRGTIITTGSFSAGAKHAALEQGAAPITLIDGKILLDLLVEYGIGISKKTVEYFEFDNSKLIEFEDENTPIEKDA